MKIRIRSVLAGAAAVAVASGMILAGGTAAYAAVTPAWEPDASALGTVSFYDVSGAAVTGGSLSDHPAAFYAVASGAGRTGDNQAQLWLATPQAGQLPPLWPQDSLTGATRYPNSAAPTNIRNLTVPVVSATTSDFSFGDYISSFPNTSTAAGYQNLYEFRLYTSGPGQLQGTTYFRLDVSVNVTGQDSGGNPTGTWTAVYPAAATPTSTALTVSPASPQPHGTAVTLTATVSPAAAGSVHFLDGTTDLGAGTYNATTGVATLTTTPADGAHSFTAQFSSTDAGFAGSTSAAVSYSITAASTSTSTALVAAPPSPVTGDASGNASVTVTATVTPTGTAGGVHFFDGTTDLGAGTYTATTGVATKVVTLTASGSPHQLTATFTPTASGTVAPSTSNVVTYVVQPANFGSAGVPVSAANSSAPYAGSLNLQVAAGTKVDLSQDAAAHPAQATDPTGHRHAWVFKGSLGGVAVNDTRPSVPGWTLTGQASDFAGPAAVPAKNLGWAPALATGGDAEGTVTAGPVVSSILKDKNSPGLSALSNLGKAAAGSGLGVQNLGAAVEFWLPDTSPTGTYTSTLTLTLISP